jgi:hypothetical protein
MNNVILILIYTNFIHKFFYYLFKNNYKIHYLRAKYNLENIEFFKLYKHLFYIMDQNYKYI